MQRKVKLLDLDSRQLTVIAVTVMMTALSYEMRCVCNFYMDNNIIANT